MLVISDEVYKYMVYEGVGGGAENVPSSVDPEAAAAALQAAKSATATATAVNGGGGGGSSSSSSGVAGRVLQPESEGGSSAAREAPPAEVANKADDVGVVEPLPALRHVHFATLPGMWDRTITISSAGKTFSVTGWQVRVLQCGVVWCVLVLLSSLLWGMRGGFLIERPFWHLSPSVLRREGCPRAIDSPANGSQKRAAKTPSRNSGFEGVVRRRRSSSLSHVLSQSAKSTRGSVWRTQRRI